MRTLFLGLVLWVTCNTTAQLNISFVGQLSYDDLHNSDIANLWGYTDEEGNEYAIVGVNGQGENTPGGVSVVSLADPANPQEVFFHPGPVSIWREVKVWNDHAYITTEAEEGGLVIVDLSPLPQSTDLTATVWMAPDWDNSHSLFIDENGRLYVHGANRGNGGVIMYDLTQDPLDPVEVGEFDTWYCHDSFARGDTLYAAHITDGFLSIVDVSDPTNPVLLGTQVTPNDFTHNVWLDASGKHLFTTDERTNAYVGAYNVEDPTDIQYLDKLRSSPGSGAIPHNTYWLDGFAVTSYYTLGVTIYDVSRPHNMVEVGNYDTSPFSGDGFNGAWGVYPFFGSQRLIISDIQQGLFVLDPDYVRACWLEGTVRNSVTSAPVLSAVVEIVGLATADPTDLSGQYATGTAFPGTYTVEVSAPGYLTATISGVVLENGELTLLDIDLDPLVSFAFLGTVVDADSGEPVPNAKVAMKSPTYAYSTQADANGVFEIPGVFTDQYEVSAGQWGWRTACPPPMTIGPGSAPLVIELEPGYYDDFLFDLGWTVSSTATAGLWERDTPVGTSYLGQTSNPGTDVNGDCGGLAFVTGNGGGGAGDDDVDDGNTLLSSPVFDASDMFDPHVFLRRWFFNAGGSGNPNDRMVIRLSNGTTTVDALTITSSASSWQQVDIRIIDHLPITPTMQVRVLVTDDAPGHLVEGAIDLFEVLEMSPVGLGEGTNPAAQQLWPNPSQGRFEVLMPGSAQALLEVFDALGRIVMDPVRVQHGRSTLDTALLPGSYTVRVTALDGTFQVLPLVIAK